MAGGAETPNIAALPAIARLGTCESARGPDADRHVKLLIQFAVEGVALGRLFTPPATFLLKVPQAHELHSRKNGRPYKFRCTDCEVSDPLRLLEVAKLLTGETPSSGVRPAAAFFHCWDV